MEGYFDSEAEREGNTLKGVQLGYKDNMMMKTPLKIPIDNSGRRQMDSRWLIWCLFRACVCT